MLAHVHHGVHAKHIAQPEVKGQVVVGRHQFSVVVAGVVVAAVQRTCGLNADEDVAQLQASNHEPAVAQHGVGLGFAPLGYQGLRHAIRQLGQALAIVLKAVALAGWAQRPFLRVVGNALL